MKNIILTIIGLVFLQTFCLTQNDEKVNYPVFLNIYENLGVAKAFQSMDNPNDWYLLPNKATIQRNTRGRYEFGFIQYVENLSSGNSVDEIDRGDGGGVVYFTIGFNLTDNERKAAEQELKRRRGGSAKVVGSVAYESGTIELVTFGMEGVGDEEGKTKVLGIGNAPLMDGDAIAVNIILNKKNATLLWKTFDKGNGNYGNIGLNFSMYIRGYHTPISAKVTMSTEEIMKNERIAAAVNAGIGNANTSIVMGAEMEKITQDLMNSGAIKIEKVGDIGDANEELIKSTVEFFRDNYFKPVSNQDMAGMMDKMRGGQSPLEKASSLKNTEYDRLREESKQDRQAIRDAFSSNNARTNQTPRTTPPPEPTPEMLAQIEQAQSENGERTTNNNEENGNRTEAQEAIERSNNQMKVGIQAYAGYFVQNINKRAEYSLELNEVRAVQRASVVTSSFPRLPESAFMQVNLDDPLYKQREIVAILDGLNAEDFGNFVNYAAISMKKKHKGGDITTDEVRIDRQNFSTEGNRFKLLYGWQDGDNDRSSWLDYEYKVAWSFFGGAELETEWISTDNQALSVSPPYQPYIVNLTGEKDLLDEQEVRSATVKIFYNVNGKEMSKVVSFNSRSGELSRDVKVILGSDLNYEYEISWILKGNKTVNTERVPGNSMIIFYDELPN